MNLRRSFRLGLAPAMLSLAGCLMTDEQMTARFIAHMDAAAPEDQLPNWETTKALMLRTAPQVGDQAPDFTLETRSGGESIRLSRFEGDRPVVLIFGSWT